MLNSLTLLIKSSKNPGEIISQGFKFNLLNLKPYILKNTLRSNKLVFMYFLLYFFIGMYYLGFSIVVSIVPTEISQLVWVVVIFSDLTVKYYLPGSFVEYVFPFLRISLSQKKSAIYVILNLFFHYLNIYVLFSALFGVSLDVIGWMLTILVINHAFIVLFKIDHISISSRIYLVSILLLAILNFGSVLCLKSLIISFIVLFLVVFMLFKFINHSLYVK
jgi:hypothetical protein